MVTRRTLGLVLPALILSARHGAAQTAALPAPAGPVVLTVKGKIGRTNAPGEARLDRAMLAALPQGRFTGETPWTKGTVTFTGPLGSALLDLVGATGSLMKVVALNDFVAEVPVDDFRQHQVILATHRDGNQMAVRDRGPLWIIYPMDRDPSLRNSLVYARSVWQIRDIDVS